METCRESLGCCLKQPSEALLPARTFSSSCLQELFDKHIPKSQKVRGGGQLFGTCTSAQRRGDAIPIIICMGCLGAKVDQAADDLGMWAYILNKKDALGLTTPRLWGVEKNDIHSYLLDTRN